MINGVIAIKQVRWLEINDEDNDQIDFIRKVANHNKYKKYEDVLINT